MVVETASGLTGRYGPPTHSWWASETTCTEDICYCASLVYVLLSQHTCFFGVNMSMVSRIVFLKNWQFSSTVLVSGQLIKKFFSAFLRASLIPSQSAVLNRLMTCFFLLFCLALMLVRMTTIWSWSSMLGSWKAISFSSNHLLILFGWRNHYSHFIKLSLYVCVLNIKHIIYIYKIIIKCAHH